MHDFDIAELLDEGPPRDVESEAGLLGCMIIMDPADRLGLIAELSFTHFHDPFHAWLFRALRFYGNKSTRGLLEGILSFPGYPLSKTRPAFEIARLIYGEKGSPVRNVLDAPFHLSRVKEVFSRRSGYDAALEQLTLAASQNWFGVD